MTSLPHRALSSKRLVSCRMPNFGQAYPPLSHDQQRRQSRLLAHRQPSCCGLPAQTHASSQALLRLDYAPPRRSLSVAFHIVGGATWCPACAGTYSYAGRGAAAAHHCARVSSAQMQVKQAHGDARQTEVLAATRRYPAAMAGQPSGSRLPARGLGRVGTWSQKWDMASASLSSARNQTFNCNLPR
jgi:hypothetical protein